MYGSFYTYGNEESDLLNHFEMIEIIFSVISIILCGLAIIGACLYSSIMIGINVLQLIIGYILGIIFVVNYSNNYFDYWEEYYDYSCCTCYMNGLTIAVASIETILWMYPHVGFIVQVQKGIMSKDTYAPEEFSCCCV